MIATSPMDPLTVRYCFPDQPFVEQVLHRTSLDVPQPRAAFASGMLFNEARFWILAGALSYERSLIERGIDVLSKLSLVARDLSANSSIQERLQHEISAVAEQLLGAFESEDFAEALSRSQTEEERFDEATGIFVATFEFLELQITRYCVLTTG